MGCSSTKPAFNPKKHSHKYDMIVIGGGSGGLACAREAAKYGASVAVCYVVTPSPMGTEWGLGGRLMHQANLIKDYIRDADAFGWDAHADENSEVKWETLVGNVQNYIDSLNSGYPLLLDNEKIQYYNCLPEFQDEHNIKLTHLDGQEEVISGQCIVIAVGGRPKYLDIPGGGEEEKLCITSDDIFSLSHPPGKTLCVGADHIAMECAGFLSGLGFEVAVMARSAVLQDFDHTVSDLIVNDLRAKRVEFMKGTAPLTITRVQRGSPPTYRVAYRLLSSKTSYEEEFNTILLAIGRTPCTSTLNLKVLPKLKTDEEGFIITDKCECTGVPHIFAIGDCAKGRPQLTPAAIRAGQWLARRIYDKKFRKVVNYSCVPTTIFTPVEYGCCGLSEEAANTTYGAKNVEVYHRAAVPLEHALKKRDTEALYAKLVCIRKGSKEKVVGFHYLGPYAGDITLGFAMAMKRQPYKDEFTELIGIHPTCAEIFTEMNISKGSQIAYIEKNC